MSTSDEVLHVYTYKAKLCEARPGDPPLLVPKAGITCSECRRREDAYMALHNNRRKREGAIPAEKKGLR